MVALVVILVVLVVAGLIAAGRSFKVVQQYEQGIIFRFGRVLPGIRGAGLTLIRPVGDRMQKVNMQIVAMAVPAQEGITKDNVTVRVDAVVYFRVVDPIKATINVQNYMFAISSRRRPHSGRSSASPRWISCSPSGTRLTASCAGSSTSQPRARGASGSSGWSSRTSPCPTA